MICHGLFSQAVRILRVLQRLLAELMGCKKISLTVSCGRGSVGVCGQIVKFCNSIVRALRHNYLRRLSRIDLNV